MDALRDYLAQLRRIWNEMNSRQRFALLGLVFLCVGGFAFIVFGQAPDRMNVLYSDLEPRDAQEITKFLDNRQEPYELTDGGQTIRVLPPRVDQLRIELASEGLPKGTGVGFEVFDDGSTMGMSEFVQNMQFRRALEGELARTISSIEEILSARVHLVMPKRRLFKEEEERPSASVVLRLSNASTLSQRSVKGIARLIASAVEGLSPMDVTILDSGGSVLKRARDDEEVGVIDGYHDLVRQYEANLKRNLVRLVEPVVGHDNVRIEVAANFDFSAVTRHKDAYDPEKQVARSEERVQEKREIEGAGKDAPGGGAGQAGNQPGGQGQVAAAGGASSTDRQTERINYEIDKVREVTRQRGATLTRLSLAVLVNGKTTPVPGGTPRYEARTPEELQQIQNLVSRAAGIDKKRGDTLEVVNLPFTQMVEMNSEGAGVGLTGIGPIVQAVAAVVIALLVVFMIARPLLSQLKEISPELVEAAALPGSVEDVAQALEEAERDARSRKLMEQRQALIELAQDDPQRAADIIRSWLGDEVHSDA